MGDDKSWSRAVWLHTRWHEFLGIRLLPFFKSRWGPWPPRPDSNPPLTATAGFSLDSGPALATRNSAFYHPKCYAYTLRLVSYIFILKLLLLVKRNAKTNLRYFSVQFCFRYNWGNALSLLHHLMALKGLFILLQITMLSSVALSVSHPLLTTCHSTQAFYRSSVKWQLSVSQNPFSSNPRDWAGIFCNRATRRRAARLSLCLSLSM